MNAIKRADSALISPELKTNSLVVAEKFVKRHEDVLRAIRNLGTPEEFNQRNFAFREQIQQHSTGAVKKIIVEMTRDGFSLLVMGFTGKRAMQWKIRFLEAFNAMEAELAKPAALGRSSRLSNSQRRQIQKFIGERWPQEQRRSIYDQLKEEFDVARYRDIRQSRFEAAIAFLEACAPEPAPAEALDQLARYLDAALEDESMMGHTWQALDQMRVIVNFLHNRSSENLALLKRRLS